MHIKGLELRQTSRSRPSGFPPENNEISGTGAYRQYDYHVLPEQAGRNKIASALYRSPEDMRMGHTESDHS